MSVIKNYFSWILTSILILSTSSCEEMEVCDGIQKIKVPSLELNFKSLFEPSDLKIFKDNKAVSLKELKDSKLTFDLNFPDTSNEVEIRYKKPNKNEVSLKIEIHTELYYVSLACGFRLIIKDFKIISESHPGGIQIDKTPKKKEEDEKKNKKTNEEQENAQENKIKLALDITLSLS